MPKMPCATTSTGKMCWRDGAGDDQVHEADIVECALLPQRCDAHQRCPPNSTILLQKADETRIRHILSRRTILAPCWWANTQSLQAIARAVSIVRAVAALGCRAQCGRTKCQWVWQRFKRSNQIILHMLPQQHLDACQAANAEILPSDISLLTAATSTTTTAGPSHQVRSRENVAFPVLRWWSVRQRTAQSIHFEWVSQPSTHSKWVASTTQHSCISRILLEHERAHRLVSLK